MTGRVRALFSGEGVGAIVARGASGAMLVQLAAAAANFLAYFVLANLLDLRSFGDYVYVLGWVNVLAQFTTLGLTSSALRYIPSYRADQAWPTLRGFIRRSGQITLLISFGAGLALAAVPWFAASAMRQDLAITFVAGGAVLVLLSQLRLVSAHVQAFRWIVRSMAPQFVLRPLAITVAIGVLRAVLGPEMSGTWAMLGNVAATALVLVLLLGFRRNATPPEARGGERTFETARWLRVTSTFLLLSGFIYLLSRIDILMLGMLRSTEDAGRYAIAAEAASPVGFGLLAVHAIVSPMISELHTKGDRAKLDRLLGLGALGSSVIGIATMLGLLLFGNWILGLFGTEFQAVYTAMIILACGELFAAILGLTGPLMTMTGHHRQAAMYATVAVAVNVALNALLIPPLGTTGAALATALALVLWNLMRLQYAIRVLRLNPTILALRRRAPETEV